MNNKQAKRLRAIAAELPAMTTLRRTIKTVLRADEEAAGTVIPEHLSKAIHLRKSSMERVPLDHVANLKQAWKTGGDAAVKAYEAAVRRAYAEGQKRMAEELENAKVDTDGLR